MKDTKTKLSLKEKSELLKLRVSKFNDYVQKNRFMSAQPKAVKNQIKLVNEIWSEIEGEMMEEIKENKKYE